MRAILAVALLLPLAGCLVEPLGVDCDRPNDMVLHFADGLELREEAQPSGERPGNAFSQAFVADDMEVWLSPSFEESVRVTGAVELEFWVRNEGSAAPVVIGGDPGEGYHFFNQFGSDRTFQPAYAIEYQQAVAEPGRVDHYNEVFEMPPGGFVLEAGDSVRVLLTSLVADGGHTILYGGDTPSQVRFTVECFDLGPWTELDRSQEPVDLPFHQGLLTGAVPATEDLNVKTIPFRLLPDTDRLTIELRQGEDRNPAKDDVDLEIIDEQGAVVWSAGSPYADETAVLWRPNLDELMPPGAYAARVNSYSGQGYQGTVTVIQDAQ